MSNNLTEEQQAQGERKCYWYQDEEIAVLFMVTGCGVAYEFHPNYCPNCGGKVTTDEAEVKAFLAAASKMKE